MWRKDPLLFVILWWTAFLAGILVWLPLVRGATQGHAYRWVLTAGIGGRGIGGSYWVLILGAAFVLPLLYLGWRGGRPPFRWLLLTFHIPLAAAGTYAAVADPRGFRFEGATIGVDVSLAVVGPILLLGFAAAGIAWVVRDLRGQKSRDLAPWVWTRAAKVRLLLLLTAVPLEVGLFRSGGLQSTQNLIGVALVWFQWVLLNRIFAGARGSSASA
jgi:hypothetical protein